MVAWPVVVDTNELNYDYYYNCPSAHYHAQGFNHLCECHCDFQYVSLSVNLYVCPLVLRQRLKPSEPLLWSHTKKVSYTLLVFHV